MFKRKEILKPAQHGGLRILETNDYAYARGEVLAPIVFDEMADIAREYPIVFPDNQSGLPCALMGLEDGQNAYVDDHGAWQGIYIPAHIRRYPFMFGKADSTAASTEAGKSRYIVLFDPDAPQLQDTNGHPVFTPDGKPSPHAQRRMALLESMQKAIPATQAMVAAIDALGLLVERSIQINKGGKLTNVVKGLKVVDEKKLNQLPDADFVSLRNQGALPLVYAHLLSWANFRQGPLAGKYPDLAAKPEGKHPSFLFESDIISFSGLS